MSLPKGVVFWLLIFGLAFAGCQTLPTSTPAPDEAFATPTQRPILVLQPTFTPTFPVAEEALKGVRVTFWHPWVGPMERQFQQLAEDFSRENSWGIQVTVHSAGSSMALADWVEQGHPNGEIAQGVVAPPTTLLYWYEHDNRLRSLDEWLTSTQWGLSEAQRAEIPLVFWQSDQISGQQVGFPAQRGARLLIYNLTWATELGFNAPPQTAEEWREQACAAAQANRRDATLDNDGTGGWLVDNDPLTALAWMRAFGLHGEFQSEDSTWNFNQPSALQAWQFLREMLDAGCAWVGRDPTPYAYFATRRALFYSGDVLDLLPQMQALRRLGVQDVWSARPFPGTAKPLVLVSGLSYGVMRTTPAQELATWLFIRWLSLPEQQARLVEAGGGLPMGPSTAALLESYRSAHPQWGESLAFIPIAQMPPNTPNWRQAQWVVQDAFAQALQSTTPREALPEILAELDATLAEIARGR